MIKILVSSEEEKAELLEASKHIHDSRDIDTDLPMVNTIAHLYQAEWIIEVDRGIEVERLEKLSDLVRQGVPIGFAEGLEVIDYQSDLRGARKNSRLLRLKHWWKYSV